MQTTSRSLIESLIGVLAIWIMVHNLPDHVAGLFSASMPSDDRLPLETIQMIISIHLVGSLSVGALLLFARRRIATWLTPGAVEVTTSDSALISIGTLLVGVLILGWGLSQTIGHIVTSLEFRNVEYSFARTGIGSLLTGIVLMLAARWMPRLWSRLPGGKRGAA